MGGMNYWPVDCTRFRAAMVALTITLPEAATSGVIAQTLIEPNSKPKLSLPSAKPQPALRTKSCSAFGAGFVQIRGTDMCIKIGGSVTVEGAANHGR